MNKTCMKSSATYTLQRAVDKVKLIPPRDWTEEDVEQVKAARNILWKLLESKGISV